MNRIRLIAPVVVVFAVTFGAIAQDGVTLKEKSVTFVAEADLNLRAAPPSGLFYRVGPKIGVIQKGSKLIATAEKTVSTLFGDYKWLQVDAVDAKTKTNTTGWVYVGHLHGEQHVKPASSWKK
jgi:hypothetical protein